MNIDTNGLAFGDNVMDTVTGFWGTVTAVCSYVTGCSQLLVQPPVGDGGDWKEPRWFDCTRLTVTGVNTKVAGLAASERDKAEKGERIGGPGNSSEMPPTR